MITVTEAKARTAEAREREANLYEEKIREFCENEVSPIIQLKADNGGTYAKIECAPRFQAGIVAYLRGQSWEVACLGSNFIEIRW
jgi:hypothetical protein